MKDELKKVGKVVLGAGGAIVSAIIVENMPEVKKVVVKKSKKIIKGVMKATGLKDKNVLDRMGDWVKNRK